MYEEAMRECERWLGKRTPSLEELMIVGTKIDVKDTEYIWCKAIIK